MRLLKACIFLHSCLLWSDYTTQPAKITNNAMNETNCCVTCPCPCVEVFDGTTLNCDSRFWLQGEILVWKHQRFNDYTEETQADSSLLATRRIRDKIVECDWLPGVRVGLGYKQPCDTFDFVGLFTYVPGHGERKERNSSPSLDIGTFFGSQSGDQQTGFEDIDLEVNSNLYIGDLEMGRHFFISPRFDFRPFLGLRTIYQNSKVTTQIENIFEDSVLELTRANIRDIDNTFGIGIRFGFNTLWGITERWAVYANWAAAVMGTSESQESSISYTVAADADENEIFVANGPPTVVKIRVPFGDCDITNELSLGLQNDYFFCNRRYHLGFRVGYEFLNLFTQNLFATTNNNYQGVTIRARFDF